MIYKIIATILLFLLYLYERAQYALSVWAEYDPIPENVQDV